jgi:voltage-gated potassium channel Kch
MSFVILELDSRRLETLKSYDFPAIFGDAGQVTILEAAEIRTAKLLLITTPVIIDKLVTTQFLICGVTP